MARIGLIGAGQMAAEICVRLIRYGGISPDEILASHHDPIKARSFRRRTHVRVLLDNRDLVENSRVVLLCVRPQQAKDASKQVAGLFADRRRSLVSIAAGVRTSSLARWIASPQVAHFHPSSLLMATDAYNPGPSLWTTHPKMAHATGSRLRKLFEKSIGEVWAVPEIQLPKYIFLAGNAPALVLRVIDAFVKAADLEPKDRQVYHAIVSALYHGVVLEKRSPSDIVSNIATKGGVTQAGLDVLEQRWHIDAIARETRDACLKRLLGLADPEQR